MLQGNITINKDNLERIVIDENHQTERNNENDNNYIMKEYYKLFKVNEIEKNTISKNHSCINNSSDSVINRIFEQNSEIYNLVSDNRSKMIDKFEELNDEINYLHSKINSKLIKKRVHETYVNAIPDEVIIKRKKIIEDKKSEIIIEEQKVMEDEEFVIKILEEKLTNIDKLDDSLLINLFTKNLIHFDFQHEIIKILHDYVLNNDLTSINETESNVLIKLSPLLKNISSKNNVKQSHTQNLVKSSSNIKNIDYKSLKTGLINLNYFKIKFSHHHEIMKEKHFCYITMEDLNKINKILEEANFNGNISKHSEIHKSYYDEIFIYIYKILKSVVFVSLVKERISKKKEQISKIKDEVELLEKESELLPSISENNVFEEEPDNINKLTNYTAAAKNHKNQDKLRFEMDNSSFRLPKSNERISQKELDNDPILEMKMSLSKMKLMQNYIEHTYINFLKDLSMKVYLPNFNLDQSNNN